MKKTEMYINECQGSFAYEENEVCISL